MGIAIITGASSGMGKDFVLELDSRFDFDEMWLIARRIDKLELVSKELKNKARILSLDLEKKEDLEKYSNLLMKSKKVYKVLKDVNMLILHIFLILITTLYTKMFVSILHMENPERFGDFLVNSGLPWWLRW